MAHPPAPASPPDPWAPIPEAPISLAPFAGQKVMALQVGLLVGADSARQRELRQAAQAALDSGLAASNSGVDWVGLEEQRRAARRNPTVAVNPDRLSTELLLDPAVERVPPSLVIGIRALSAMTGSRHVLAPAALRLTTGGGMVTATWVVVLADSRTGNVLARLRASGSGATAEEAMRAAAGRIVAPQ